MVRKPVSYSDSSSKWFRSLLEAVFAGPAQITSLVRDRLERFKATRIIFNLNKSSLYELSCCR
jgi:hypothetical protein